MKKGSSPVSSPKRVELKKSDSSSISNADFVDEF